MKKKVFFIMSTDDYSGAEAVNLDIMKKMKDDFDFYWVSKKGNINTYLDKNNFNWIEIKELSVKEIKRVVKEYKPDILHATDYRASTIACLAKSGTPVIAHLHNNPPWLKKLSINSLALLLVGLKSKKILTVSESIENEYIFSRFIKNKIVMIDNPIDREKILGSVTVNEDKIYDICMTARLTEQKNPQRFIRLIEKLKEKNSKIKAVIIGDGELKEECQTIIKQKNLTDNVILKGFLKNPFNDMKQSKVFCLTSDWEGYGLVAFEALTLGVPVVVSNVGGLPNIVDNECGKLCNTDEEFITEIDKLLNDNEYYKTKKENALEKAGKIENINSYINKLEDIYNSVSK